MARWRLLCAVLGAAVLPVRAQVGNAEFEALRQGEMQRYVALAGYLKNAVAGTPSIDVSYYKLNIRAADQQNFLSGDVIAVSSVIDPSLTAIEYDLTNTMHVDSVLVDGTPASCTADVSTIRITTPKTYHAGDRVMTRVYYHGYPSHTGLGSYSDSLRADGTRWIFTLSEPYGARDWWPCIDHPMDKADSADISITCSGQLLAVTNGKLIGTIQNADGTKTYNWKHRYPIASYLISATIGNFTTFSDWYKYSPTDSMEVVNYVLPTVDRPLSSYRLGAGLTPRMLEIYSALFGQYPFIKEKYGHAEFGWGGGMEHQTLTSLGTRAFSETTIAHELAHQWFGDMITCRTWPDLWLNEGFATYFESVYREKQYGTAAYVERMAERDGDAKNARGTLSVQDTADVNNLFASSRVYNKGSWVLHMLRHTVGDSFFFASIYAYAHDPAVRYGTASTADLRAVFERTTGRDLGWFFDEWVYGEKFPTYTCQYFPAQHGSDVVTTLTIGQTTGTTNPVFFTMPIDLRFASSGWDTTVTVWNDAPNQTFEIRMTHWPDTVQIDRNNWLLKYATVKQIVVGVQRTEQPQTFFLAQNYPNPFNPTATISFGVAERSIVSIRIYDILGREAATVFEGEKPAGSYSVPLDARALSSGVYLYRMTAQHGRSIFSETKRLVVVK
jgi:aminopeptidase N